MLLDVSLRKMYSWHISVGVVTLRMMLDARRVACMGEVRDVYRVLVGNSRGTYHLAQECTDFPKLKDTPEISRQKVTLGKWTQEYWALLYKV